MRLATCLLLARTTAVVPGGGAFDVSTLPLTLWLKEADYVDDAGGGDDEGSWASSASAGSSGGRGPAVQATPSKVPVADGGAVCDGTNDDLVCPDACDSYVAVNKYLIAGVVSAATVEARVPNNAYLNEAFYADDGNGFLYGTFTDGGITIGHYSSGFKEINAPATVVDDHYFIAWYDGTHLNLIVDGEAATPVLAGEAFPGFGGGVLVLGRNYNGSARLNGRVREFMTCDDDLDEDARAGIEAYLVDKFFGEEEAPPAQLRGTNHNIYSQSTWTAGAPNPGSNYVATDSRTLDYYASKGMNFIRLMFTWEWIQPTLNASIPGSGAYLTYWNAFVATVDAATAMGITVLIEHFGSADNFWGGGGANTVPAWKGVGSGDGVSFTNQIGGGSVTNADFCDLWTKLADYFKDNPLVVYGMCNEPHDMSTMQWFATAQAVITAIRDAGATTEIFVPGNGYATSDWTDNSYDSAGTQRSSAYGWENANGLGSPLVDPLNKLVASCHVYVDDAGGSTVDSPPGTAIIAVGAGTRANAAVDRFARTVDWAIAYNVANPGNEIAVHCSEIGFKSSYLEAQDCWDAFVAYCEANPVVVRGWSWWGSSEIGWWDDTGETHFAITPTTGGTPYSGDTGNMDMIENDFA